MTDLFGYRCWLRSDDGFSFFELLAVLLLISILLLVTLNRSFIDNKDLRFEADLLKSNLRYVQQLALNNDDGSMRIDFSPDKYTVSKTGSNDSLPFPNGDGPVHILHPNISLAVRSGGKALFHLEFGGLGGIITKSETGDFTVTLTDNRSGAAESFHVIQNTGYIP